MTQARAVALALLISVAPTLALAETTTFSVIFGGKNIGHVIADTKGDVTTVDFNVKNNGRGPTMAETIRSNADGLPVEWSIKGATTFGSKVEEHFSQSGTHAEWLDSTGKGSGDDRGAAASM